MCCVAPSCTTSLQPEADRKRKRTSKMAYAVDHAIRAQGMKIASQQEGEDGGSWLSSKAAQRMSLAEPEAAHCRTMISKFGGVIRVGTAAAIPKQSWNKHKVTEFEDSYNGRHQPSHVVVNSAIAGYAGHRPEAPQVSSLALDQKACRLYPTDIQCDSTHSATLQWGMPHRRADLESPYVKPYLKAFGIPTDMYKVDAHAPDNVALTSISALPAAWQSNNTMGNSGMPEPGYRGHLPQTKGNAVENFGTSFFRQSKPATRRAQVAHAHAFARERATLSGVQLTQELTPIEREYLSC